MLCNAAEYGDTDMHIAQQGKFPVRREDSGRWDAVYEAVLEDAQGGAL